jgi:hypothetical protein
VVFLDALIDEIFTTAFLTRHHGSLFEKFLLRQDPTMPAISGFMTMALVPPFAWMTGIPAEAIPVRARDSL